MNKCLNICQVSLARDIPIIKINYENFKKLYSNLKFFIICKNKEKNLFEKYFNNENFEIIDEDSILSYYEFEKFF